MEEEKKVNAAATRLPFGLCEAHGIKIHPDWTPRDAWNALKGEGIIKEEDNVYKQHFGEKNPSDEQSKLEHEAVEWYVSGDGMLINQALRGSGEIPMDSLSDNERKLLSALDKATNKDTVVYPVLYRSVDASSIFGNMSAIEYDNLRGYIVYGDTLGKGAYADSIRTAISNRINQAKSKEHEEKGFMSTTTDLETAVDWEGYTGSEKPIVLEITPAKNTKGLDLTEHFMDQSEVLLARGQKYVIDSIEGKRGSIYVKVRLK